MSETPANSENPRDVSDQVTRGAAEVRSLIERNALLREYDAIEAESDARKRRATRLSVDQVRAIDHFCGSLFIMFPKMLGVAHVGSSLVRDDWRDVDLRVVMDDVDLAVLRGALDLDDLHMLLSLWGQRVTGLPIDCQLQPQSEHQRESFGPNGGPRHNWRGRDRLYANARRIRDAVSVQAEGAPK